MKSLQHALEAAQQSERSARESVAASEAERSLLMIEFNAKEAEWAKDMEELDSR